MKKIYALSMGLMLGTAGAFAQSFTVADFETGSATVISQWGSVPASAATIENMIGGTTGSLNSSAKCAKVVLAEWNSYLGIDVTLPNGKVASDYNYLTMKVYVNDFTYKSFDVKAKEGTNALLSISAGMQFNNANNEWVNLAIPLTSSALATISSNSFKLYVGANNDAGTYYIDNIALAYFAPSVDANTGDIAIANYELLGDNVVLPIWSKWGQQNAIAGEVKPVISSTAGAGNASTNACKATLLNWDQYLGFNIAIPNGKTIADYQSVTFKALVDMQTAVGLNPAGMSNKTYRLYAKNATGDEFSITSSTVSTASIDNQWTNITLEIDQTAAAAIAANSFTMILGVGAQYGHYWIDDVVLKAVSTSSPVLMNSASNSTVYSTSGTINVVDAEGAIVDVYSLTGVKMSSAIVDSSYSVNVAAGIYIVTIDGISTKVIVK